MNPAESDIVIPADYSPASESRNCVDIWIEGPGDYTIRPLRPALVKYALAEQEQLKRWQALDASKPANGALADG